MWAGRRVLYGGRKSKGGSYRSRAAIGYRTIMTAIWANQHLGNGLANPTRRFLFYSDWCGDKAPSNPLRMRSTDSYEAGGSFPFFFFTSPTRSLAEAHNDVQCLYWVIIGSQSITRIPERGHIVCSSDASAEWNKKKYISGSRSKPISRRCLRLYLRV